MVLLEAICINIYQYNPADEKDKRRPLHQDENPAASLDEKTPKL